MEKENGFNCKDERTLKQIAMKCCGVSVLGDIQNWTRHSHEQPVLVDPALSRGLN